MLTYVHNARVCVCVYIYIYTHIYVCIDCFLHQYDRMNCSEIGLLIYSLFNDAISSYDNTSQHRMV